MKYNFDYNLIVYGKKGTFELINYCIGEIVITYHKTGSASCLEFTVAKNIGGEFSFIEGEKVKFFVNNEAIFSGYVFSKERNGDNFIKVCVFDSLRYLKNKDTYIYSYKTASEVVKMLANDFKLDFSQIDNSEYKISYRIEENKTLFDIIASAIEITYKNTGKRFVLFDNAGSLYFKNENNLILPLSLSVTDNSIIDFSCKTDIDRDTFTKVKLFQRNKTKKIDKSFVVQSDSGINDFGVLQYYEKMPDYYNDFQIKNYAQNILKNKSRIKKTLSVKCIGLGIGEQYIRAGNSIFIKNLDIGEEIINGYVIINKCIHRFSNSEHIIELFF